MQSLHDIPKEITGLPYDIDNVLKGILYAYPESPWKLLVIPNRRSTRTNQPYTIIFESNGIFDDEMWRETRNNALYQFETSVPHDYQYPVDRVVIRYD